MEKFCFELVNLLMLLHMEEQETGRFIDETKVFQLRFLAERCRHRVLARSFL